MLSTEVYLRFEDLLSMAADIVDGFLEHIITHPACPWTDENWSNCENDLPNDLNLYLFNCDEVADVAHDLDLRFTELPLRPLSGAYIPSKILHQRNARGESITFRDGVCLLRSMQCPSYTEAAIVILLSLRSDFAMETAPGWVNLPEGKQAYIDWLPADPAERWALVRDFYAKPNYRRWTTHVIESAIREIRETARTVLASGLVDIEDDEDDDDDDDTTPPKINGRPGRPRNKLYTLIVNFAAEHREDHPNDGHHEIAAAFRLEHPEHPEVTQAVVKRAIDSRSRRRTKNR